MGEDWQVAHAGSEQEAVLTCKFSEALPAWPCLRAFLHHVSLALQLKHIRQVSCENLRDISALKRERLVYLEELAFSLSGVM